MAGREFSQCKHIKISSIGARLYRYFPTPDPWKGSTAYVRLTLYLFIEQKAGFLLTENVLPFQGSGVGKYLYKLGPIELI